LLVINFQIKLFCLRIIVLVEVNSCVCELNWWWLLKDLWIKLGLFKFNIFNLKVIIIVINVACVNNQCFNEAVMICKYDFIKSSQIEWILLFITVHTWVYMKNLRYLKKSLIKNDKQSLLCNHIKSLQIHPVFSHYYSCGCKIIRQLNIALKPQNWLSFFWKFVNFERIWVIQKQRVEAVNSVRKNSKFLEVGHSPYKVMGTV